MLFRKWQIHSTRWRMLVTSLWKWSKPKDFILQILEVKAIPLPFSRLWMTACTHKLNTRHWHLSGKRFLHCKLNVTSMKLVISLICFSDVRDIHDVLEITIFDEDKEHKYEFLGKVILSKIFHSWILWLCF